MEKFLSLVTQDKSASKEVNEKTLLGMGTLKWWTEDWRVCKREQSIATLYCKDTGIEKTAKTWKCKKKKKKEEKRKKNSLGQKGIQKEIEGGR